MPSTTEVVTLTDEQLSDLRETISAFYELGGNYEVRVHDATVEVAGGKKVQVRYDSRLDEFVADISP